MAREAADGRAGGRWVSVSITSRTERYKADDERWRAQGGEMAIALQHEVGGLRREVERGKGTHGRPAPPAVQHHDHPVGGATVTQTVTMFVVPHDPVAGGKKAMSYPLATDMAFQAQS